MTIIHFVKKAQKGDDKAFIKIFQHYEEDIYRMAFVYVKNQEDALDIVQEVAYQSFKKVHTLKQPEYFKTWLLRITINCAVGTVKKSKNVIQLISDYEEFIGSADEDLPLSLTIQSLIDTLQEDEKSIILLRFYQGYTFKEISEVLEIPLGTAKSVLYRALGKLRKEIKEDNRYEQ
ncbi:sigma-70 family RNA polymerase sigma factor [bacterium LRH843]|nr:sigma-70 family RNA polymerase sigma factor [bacterium LRH843]